MQKKLLPWINLALFIVLVIINYLTATGKMPGLLPQKEVSQLFSTPITPAGFAFSIWGVIYTLLLIVIIHTLTKSSNEIRKAVSAPLFAMFIFNISWNIAFGMTAIGTSVIMILAYLLCLVNIGYRLSILKEKVSPIFDIAFGIHTGWIAIASIVNIFAYLVQIQFSALTANFQLWTIIGVVLAVVLIIALQLYIKNPYTPIATVWALFGIYSKDSTSYTEYSFIPAMLIICIAVLLGLSAFTFLSRKRKIISN